MIAEVLLLAAAAYLLCGFVFAIPFVLLGVAKIDPHAARGSWGFRVLIIPGTMFFWPLLARRWMGGVHQPPEEKNPHRCAVRHFGSRRREEALTEMRRLKSGGRSSQSLVTSTPPIRGKGVGT